MRRNVKWLAGAAAVGALAFAGASTFTSSASLPSQSVVGYGTVSTSGGAVQDISYTLDGNNPPGVTGLVLKVDTSTSANAPTVKATIDGSSMSSSMTACTESGFTADQATTPYTCAFSSPYLTATAVTETDIAIADS